MTNRQYVSSSAGYTYEVERYAKMLYAEDSGAHSSPWRYLGEDLRKRYRRQAVDLLEECYRQLKEIP